MTIIKYYLIIAFIWFVILFSLGCLWATVKENEAPKKTFIQKSKDFIKAITMLVFISLVPFYRLFMCIGFICVMGKKGQTNDD